MSAASWGLAFPVKIAIVGSSTAVSYLFGYDRVLADSPAGQAGPPKNMAGVAGFEPAHDGIKTRCLTTWLHPIRPALNAQMEALLRVDCKFSTDTLLSGAIVIAGTGGVNANGAKPFI